MIQQSILNWTMAVWSMVQLVILTSKCLIQFKTKHSEYALVPSEHLQFSSLQVYSKRPPLNLRRTNLGLQYALQLKSNTLSPTHKIVFQPQFAQLFANEPKSTPTFGIFEPSTTSKLQIFLIDIYRQHQSSQDPSLVTLHAIYPPQPHRRQDIRHLLYFLYDQI